MSRPHRMRAILGLLVVFGVLPALFILGVYFPLAKRSASDRVRMEAAIRRNLALPNIQPLTALERQRLQDPQAFWKKRIPYLEGDVQKLAHYHQVVTELQRQLHGQGIRMGAVRSEWAPIKGSYTLPVGGAFPAAESERPGLEGRLEAWVLEVQVEGSPAAVFKALETLPRIEPLLEPVALRWDLASDPPRQLIVLRNLVSVP